MHKTGRERLGKGIERGGKGQKEKDKEKEKKGKVSTRKEKEREGEKKKEGKRTLATATLGADITNDVIHS